jgi:glycosyltransferase involved in cell wall biosynthesis
MARHVALLLPALEIGGAEHVTLALARGFVARSLQVDLVLIRAGGPLSARVPDGVRQVDLASGRTLSSAPALVRYLRRERPDTLLATNTHCGVVAAAARALARVSTRLVIRQGITLSWYRGRTLRRLVVHSLARRLFPLADAVVAVSKGVARDVVAFLGVPQERVHVVPSPLIPDNLDALAAEAPAHVWLDGASGPVVLGVGRLVPAKDWTTLIRAFAALQAERDVRLIILGEGPERPALDALVRRLGQAERVSLPGAVANPFSYMRRAAVFALSSASEGMPGVLVQALACGVPVVATDCESGPRELAELGAAVRLVPVGDVTALARAIGSAIQSPRGSGDSRACSAYCENAAVEAYLRLI